MAEKDELIATITAARRKLDKIEDAEIAERAKAFLGKCFRYNNSYGSGSRWWLYVKVIRIAKDGTLIGHQFQRTDHGIYEIEPGRRFYRGHIGGGYQEITEHAYNTAWAAFQKSIAGMKP